MQEARSAGSQKAGNQEQFRALCEFRAYANFSACAKLPASHFLPRTTPFCIFSNFTPDVIPFDMGILVFHFFIRLYIAILCTVERG